MHICHIKYRKMSCFTLSLSTLGETCAVPNDDTLAGKAEDRTPGPSKKAGNPLQSMTNCYLLF